MSSSTSSSSPIPPRTVVRATVIAPAPVSAAPAARSEAGAAARGPGWRAIVKAVLPLVVLLLVVEVGIRIIEPRLSLDILHIRRIPEIAAGMREAEGTRVLFLGNSLTRLGVNLDVVDAGLEELGSSGASLHAIYPDDTTVLDWLYLFEDAVVRAGAAPELLVIGFSHSHLADAPVRPAQTYRLGRFFTAWQDVPRLFVNDVTELDDRVSVVASKLSAAFADRERLSSRFLDLLPGYRNSSRQINDVLGGQGVAPKSGATATFDRLARLASVATEAGSRVVFVAMPTRSGYEVAPDLLRAVAVAGANIIDLRQVPGLESEHFLDSLHLGSAGAELYSEALVAELQPFVADSAPSR